MDETDVDSYFYHNFLDISQSHRRIVRVSKGSNKKSLAFRVFHFSDLKLQQRFILKEEVSISKKETESLLDSLGKLLKAFDQANIVSQIPLPKPKFEIGFTKAKNELFSHCYMEIIEHLNRQIRFSFQSERNKTCVFSIKKFEHYGDQFIFTDVVDLGYREIKHLYKNRFFVAYKCDIFESNDDIKRQIKENNSPPITVTCTTKVKMSPNMEQTHPFPIGWWFEQRIHFSNHFVQFQSAVNHSNLINLQKILIFSVSNDGI